MDAVPLGRRRGTPRPSREPRASSATSAAPSSCSDSAALEVEAIRVLVQIIWEALVPILVEMLSLAEVLALVRAQMRAARAALVTPLGLDLQAKPQETERGIQSVENNAARHIRWAEEKVMLLSEFTASALPVNLGAVSANIFEEVLERHKLLESEAIAALADARTASPASPADAALQIRLK
ncbi:unnamed protein product, partial [Prorocentrum cordatum]